MARTDLPVTNIIRTGVGNPGTLIASDETDNMEFVNDGRTLIAVLKTGGAGILTFKTPGTVDTKDIAQQIVTPGVDATKVTLIGPFPPRVYNQTDGTVHIDLDDETTLTIGAFRLPA